MLLEKCLIVDQDFQRMAEAVSTLDTAAKKLGTEIDVYGTISTVDALEFIHRYAPLESVITALGPPENMIGIALAKRAWEFNTARSRICIHAPEFPKEMPKLAGIIKIPTSNLTSGFMMWLARGLRVGTN